MSSNEAAENSADMKYLKYPPQEIFGQRQYIFKEVQFIKLNESDKTKSENQDKYEKKLFNDIFKKDVKQTENALLFISFVKDSCKSCEYFNNKADSVIEEKGNVGLIMVSMDNNKEDQDKLLAKQSAKFIEFERKDIRDELVARFRIDRVPYILAFHVYYDMSSNRYVSDVINKQQNLIPKMKDLDDLIKKCKKEQTPFTNLKIEKKLRDDLLKHNQASKAIKDDIKDRKGGLAVDPKQIDIAKAKFIERIKNKELIVEFDPVDRLNRPQKQIREIPREQFRKISGSFSIQSQEQMQIIDECLLTSQAADDDETSNQIDSKINKNDRKDISVKECQELCYYSEHLDKLLAKLVSLKKPVQGVILKEQLEIIDEKNKKNNLTILQKMDKDEYKTLFIQYDMYDYKKSQQENKWKTQLNIDGAKKEE